MTRYHLFLLGVLLLIILGPAAFTQPGGPWGGRGKGKGPDPSMMFNMFSKGAETFDVSKVEIPEFMTRWEPAEKQKERMMTFLQKKGVTNGVMTRQLYTEFSEERMREMGKMM